MLPPRPLALLGLVALLASAPGAQAEDRATTRDRIEQDIALRYPDPPERTALVEASIQGMVGALDRWSRYYTPAEVAAATADPADLGIDAEVGPADCGLAVRAVSGAAEAAGVRAGDCVTHVDGVALAGLAPELRAGTLLGTARSASVLKVLRDGRPALIAVQRGWRGGAPLEASTVPCGVGHAAMLRVRSVPAGLTALWSAADRAAALAADRIVVDLRGDPGGDMDEAVRFVDLFAREGVILSTDVRGEGPRTYRAVDDGGELARPITVWVDGGTASAAEIVASGLQALAGARVVGRTPVGKRSIQTTLRYEDGSALQLTIGHFVVAGGALRLDAPVAPDADDAAWWSATCGA